MAKKISMTSTKNEMLAAYNELLKQMESKTEEPKAVQQQLKKQETVKQVSGLSVDSIIKNITDLKMNVTGTLDKLEEQMTITFKEFEKIKEAVNVEKEDLEELYQITANAHTLSALLTAQKQKQEAFENESEELRQQRKQEETNMLNELKETKVSIEKERKREEEEYKYNLKIERKKEQDTYEEKKLKLEKELEEKKSLFEKEMAEREATVKLTEDELSELRKKADEFPKILEKELAGVQKETEGRLHQQFEFESQLTENKTSGQFKLNDQTIETLKDKIKDQEALIKQLTQKVDGSEESVKQIALKALDTSGKERIVTIEKKDAEK